MSNRPSTPALQRFQAKFVVAPSGCWQWTATLGAGGYGAFHAEGRGSTAHRWSFQHFVGPIPAGLTIDHLCRNRGCVNPAHLEAVEHRVNLMRAPSSLAARNTAKTECPAGHPYDAKNTYVGPSRGDRSCRACKRESARRRWAA